MSLFEDVLEVHYDALRRVDGPRTVETIERALDSNIHDADDVTVVVDWDTAHHIEDGLMHIDLDLDLPESHVETSCDRIGRAIGGKTLVMGTHSGLLSFGVALHPTAVNYANEVINPRSVVAIDFND